MLRGTIRAVTAKPQGPASHIQALVEEAKRLETLFIPTGDHASSERVLRKWLRCSDAAYEASRDLRSHPEHFALCEKATMCWLSSLLWSVYNCAAALELHARRTNFQNLFGPSKEELLDRPERVLRELANIMRDPFTKRRESEVSDALALRAVQLSSIGRFLEPFGFGSVFRHHMKPILPFLQKGLAHFDSVGLEVDRGFTDAEIAAIMQQPAELPPGG
jgi:hypothetical protein